MHKISWQLSGVLVIIAVLLGGCNLPVNVVGNSAPELSAEQVAGTAVAAVYTEQAAAAPSSTPPPSPAEHPAAPAGAGSCNPTVTATTEANVRSGPSTEYSVVGYLPLGGSAVIAGANDSHSWWYVVFPGGPGGYGWIAGSVATATCLPSVVNVVAAPPLPAAPPPSGPSPTPVPPGWIGPLLNFPLYIIPSPTPTLIFFMPTFTLPDFSWP